MTATEFAYWLQGFAELNGAPPTVEQWQSIQEHLKLVFVKVTPPVKQVAAIGLGQQLNPQLNAYADRVVC